MAEFNSETCDNKLMQGCTYTAGKCPCRLKKITNEKEYEQQKERASEHWKSVVLCKECKYHEDDFNVCSNWQTPTSPDGWCHVGVKKDETEWS